MKISKLLLLPILFIFHYSLFINIASATSTSVEDIFTDIDSDYKYLYELQTLYDKGMISPDEEGKFNPYSLLTREEFVGITLEVGCIDCIRPNVDYELVLSYKTTPFYDVSINSDYFYCIADSLAKGYIQGYHTSYTCDDGTYLEGKSPFCSNNNIILEEALAIILRVSGILTNYQAELIRNEIYSGIITEKLSEDVSPKNIDGSVYSFYPDFKKALDYEVVEYDKNGNKQSYFLVNNINGKLYPKKNITKEEFLKMAFVALKANNCSKETKNDLSSNIHIYPSSCTKEQENCSLNSLSDNNIYDFKAESYTTCSSGIDNPNGYIWSFYNEDNGEEIIRYGKYLDNFELASNGTRKIYLRVIDNHGNTSQSFDTLIIGEDNLLVSIDAQPLYGLAPFKVDFEGVVFGDNPIISYEWDFGDGSIKYGKFQDFIFKNAGIYEVTLFVEDEKGNTGDANVFINVFDKASINEYYGQLNEKKDSDDDNGDDNGDDDGGDDGDDGDGDDGDDGGGDDGDDGGGDDGDGDDGGDGDGDDGDDGGGDDGDGDDGGDGDGDDGDDGGGDDGDGDDGDDGDGDDGDGDDGDGDGDGDGVIDITELDDDVDTDFDNDGVEGDEDKCPNIEGDENNNGCPILSDTCASDDDCNDGYYCDPSGVCLLKNETKDFSNYLCNGNNSASIISGNIICNKCPCSSFLDFRAMIRECDYILPAITSPDYTEIYGQGQFYQIK